MVPRPFPPPPREGSGSETTRRHVGTRQNLFDNLNYNNVQVIKNIKNVAGCRDTRTAKSKETRGMIEHNSEVYNPPPPPPPPTEIFFHIYMYNEKRYVGVIVYFTVMFDHPSCFLTFCRSGIPTSCYIFNVFYYLFM